MSVPGALILLLISITYLSVSECASIKHYTPPPTFSGFYIAPPPPTEVAVSLTNESEVAAVLVTELEVAMAMITEPKPGN